MARSQALMTMDDRVRAIRPLLADIPGQLGPLLVGIKETYQLDDIADDFFRRVFGVNNSEADKDQE